MDLESACASFCEEFLVHKPVVGSKVKFEREQGWMATSGDFDKVFDDLVKKSSFLNEMTETLLKELQEQKSIMIQTNEDLKSETNKLEEKCSNEQEKCESLKRDIEELKEKLLGLKSGETTYEDEMAEIKTVIEQQKKLLLQITRLHWDEKKMKKNILKGYVCHNNGSDVSTFEMPHKATNPTSVSDFLWDYVGSGISNTWKN